VNHEIKIINSKTTEIIRNLKIIAE
jgi:hypothetical protein